MHAERVNGYDPLAVIDAVSRKKKLLLEGKGPALLDVVTYRVSGHSPSDSSTYRTQEEIEAWKAADPIVAFKTKLILGGIATENEIATMHEQITARMTEVMKLAINDDDSHVAEMMADGANMGMKSIAKVMNACPSASSDSRTLASDLIGEERQFFDSMLRYL
jgi:2-oxoisovalerate dehydrogenase E1 component